MKFLLVTIFAIALCLPASAQKLKVGTVNMAKLLTEFHENKSAIEAEKAAVAEIRTAEQDRVSAIEAMVEEIREMKVEFDDDSLSPARRKEIAEKARGKEATLAALQREREEFLQRSQGQLREKMTNLARQIRMKVNAAVEAYAATQDVDLVFDESGLTMSQTPFLLYVRKPIELTDAVLTNLNKNAPSASE